MIRFRLLVILHIFGAIMMVTSLNSSSSMSIKNKLVMASSATGQIQGEVKVQSPPLFVRGPPKGFPLVRQRRSENLNLTSAVTESSIDVKNSPLDDHKHGGGGKRKRKGGGGIMKKIRPFMFVPAMIGIGLAPFLLSQLKMMVMSAFMVNMMALNAAIFLTLRNMVFGPRSGEHVKYYNFGYSGKDKHSHHRHR